MSQKGEKIFKILINLERINNKNNIIIIFQIKRYFTFTNFFVNNNNSTLK